TLSNDFWHQNFNFSEIFKYLKQEELVNFNSVCKRWNLLTNPIIHRELKLLRSDRIREKVHGKKYDSSTKVNAEAKECISNNSKFAPFVKEFELTSSLLPKIKSKLFETFNFISVLTLQDINIDQCQFLGIIDSLKLLNSLILTDIKVNNNSKDQLYTSYVQLPSSLNKLALTDIQAKNNPELFFQTINSHANLKELCVHDSENNIFLEPLYKNNASLLSFEYYGVGFENLDPLYKLIEFNSQLVNLKLYLYSFTDKLYTQIAGYLTNLEEIFLSLNTSFIIPSNMVKSSAFEKVKIFKLISIDLNYTSVKSILENCPKLEELELKGIYKSLESDLPKSLNLARPTKIKKLEINIDNIDQSLFDIILSNSPSLNELEVRLHNGWQHRLKTIWLNSKNLKKLIIWNGFKWKDGEKQFIQEFYQTGLLANASDYNINITQLSFIMFGFSDARADNFDSFKRLKSIKFLDQSCEVIKTEGVDIDLWKDYKLRISDNGEYTADVEFYKNKI
ncbi:hypothetical protein CONCODRAFT_10686, partial [Conidiobolus coronatus NRRL 28638]